MSLLPHHENTFILQPLHLWSRSWSNFHYTPLPPVILFSVKRKNIPTPDTKKLHDLHQTSHVYAFLLNLHMNDFPCLCTSTIPTYKLKRLKKVYIIDCTQNPTESHTYIYMYKLKNTIYLIPNYVPIFSASSVRRTCFNKKKCTRNNTNSKTHH